MGGALIAAVLLGISAPPPTPGPATPEPRPARRPPAPIAAVALAATGVVGIAGGVLFGWRAHQAEAEIENQKGLASNELYQERVDRGRHAARLQWLSYGVGAGALLGAAAVYLFTRPGHEPAPVTASVAAGPSSAGLTIGGRF
jgi:hypothetical protein